MTCQQQLMNEGKPYPRTCQECGLGPCKHDRMPARQQAFMDWGEMDNDLNHIVYSEVGGDTASRLINRMRVLLRKAYDTGRTRS